MGLRIKQILDTKKLLMLSADSVCFFASFVAYALSATRLVFSVKRGHLGRCKKVPSAALLPQNIRRVLTFDMSCLYLTELKVTVKPKNS